MIVSEVLQAITSHRADGEPLSLEAGILRVADALDMAKGRSRIPFERGSVSIHSLSAAAIDEVRIGDGAVRPVMVEIVMNNSSGIYQVDGLLKAKLRGSGLEPYVEVVARIDTEAEKRLVPVYHLEIGEPGRPSERPTARLRAPLRGRLTAGRLALDQEVGVRIPAPQPPVRPSVWAAPVAATRSGAAALRRLRVRGRAHLFGSETGCTYARARPCGVHVDRRHGPDAIRLARGLAVPRSRLRGRPRPGRARSPARCAAARAAAARRSRTPRAGPGARRARRPAGCASREPRPIDEQRLGVRRLDVHDRLDHRVDLALDVVRLVDHERDRARRSRPSPGRVAPRRSRS